MFKRVGTTVALVSVLAVMSSGVSASWAAQQPNGNPHHDVRDPGVPDAIIKGGDVAKRMKPKVDAAQVQSSAQASRIVVRYKSGISTKAATELANEAVVAVDTEASAEVVTKSANGFRVVVLDQPVPNAQAEQIASELQSQPDVKLAEVDGRAFPQDVVEPFPDPDDTYYEDQWDISDFGAGNGVGVNASRAWTKAANNGPTPVVAVLDTGMTEHPDLAGKTVAGYDMLREVVVANDGDGRDADPADPGDWVTGPERFTSDLLGCEVENSTWHGTHVAGTIGAIRGNNKGIAGMVPDARIQPVRVLGKCGGPWSDIADGITWASGGSVPGVSANATPARVLNLSLGGRAQTCPAILQAAIDGARTRNATVVVSAGNSDENAAGFTPANCNGVVNVAATDIDGKRSEYSNYGASVDIAAPGGDWSHGVYSTFNNGSREPGTSGYKSLIGTSMAAPHVSAAAALKLAQNPALTPAQVEQAIKSSASKLPKDSAYPEFSCGTDRTCGVGLLNATSLLGATATPGPLPDLRVEVVDDSTLRVTHEAPAEAYTARTINYYTDDENEDWVQWPVSPDGLVTVSGTYEDYQAGSRPLVASDIKSVEMFAEGLAGRGERTLGFIYNGEPGPIAAKPIATAGNGQISVTWQGATDPGSSPITGYRVSINGGEFCNADVCYTDVEVAAQARSATVTGLKNGEDYRVAVSPINAKGGGPYYWSKLLVVGAAAPVQQFSQQARPGMSRISWNAPAQNGGSPVIGYRVTRDENDQTVQFVTGTSVDYTGLVPRSAHSVTVTPVTAIGDGAKSTDWWIVSDVPTAPSVATVVPGAGAAEVTWSAPTEDNGAVVTGYVVTAAPGGATCVTNGATQCRVIGLTNGTAYTFTVAARNAVGLGASSPASRAVTPQGSNPPVVVPQTQSVTGVPTRLKKRKKATLPSTSSAGLRLSWKGKGACKVKGYKVVAGTKSGKCKLVVTAPASLQWRALNAKYAIKVK